MTGVTPACVFSIKTVKAYGERGESASDGR